MTQSNLYKFFDKVVAEARAIFVTRNEKRAYHSDALSNLRSEALICGIDVQQLLITYIGVKFARLQHAVLDGSDCTDTLRDMLNYLILLEAVKHKEAK